MSNYSTQVYSKTCKPHLVKLQQKKNKIGRFDFLLNLKFSLALPFKRGALRARRRKREVSPHLFRYDERLPAMNCQLSSTHRWSLGVRRSVTTQ